MFRASDFGLHATQIYAIWAHFVVEALDHSSSQTNTTLHQTHLAYSSLCSLPHTKVAPSTCGTKTTNEHSTHPLLPISILTSDNRDLWTNMRGCISKECGTFPENQEHNDHGGVGQLEASYMRQYQLGNIDG